jgi:hypothetical protein
MKFPDWLPVYGDTDYRNKKCPVESAEQITFFNTLRREYQDSYGLIAIHPRNEGKRTFSQVARQKAEGMTPGASDIIIPGNPSFVCELKRLDHTLCGWEDGQVEYLEAAMKNGSFVCVALGHKAALEALQVWIGN